MVVFRQELLSRLEAKSDPMSAAMAQINQLDTQRLSYDEVPCFICLSVHI